jgi:hypothetical protein
MSALVGNLISGCKKQQGTLESLKWSRMLSHEDMHVLSRQFKHFTHFSYVAKHAIGVR